MKLSISYKFAFLCIPKCGSSSLEIALSPFCQTTLGGHPSLKHINARMFQRHIRPLLGKAVSNNDLETFCIMREPIERIFSWYQYLRRDALQNPEHPGHYKYTGRISFEDFVEGYISLHQPAYAKIGTQANFIYLENGDVGVDRIFRLDHLEAVHIYLRGKIGRDITIGKENQSIEKPREIATGRQSYLKKGLNLFSKFQGLRYEEPESSDKSLIVMERAVKMKELSDPLLSRLKNYLAADYELYNSLVSK